MIDIRFRHDFAPTPSGAAQGAIDLDIAFSAPSPGATVLFGPSGAGKSSVVAALAGLLRPRSARIAVDDAVLSDTSAGVFLPPERRRLGLVFQDARLFPHLSVDGNLRYGMRRAPPGPFAFDRVIDLLGIGALLRRRPHTLSGGERQRVAIGRALLSQPRLLLMDEPLASLDAARRAEILAFVVALKESLPIPIVYVTHDAEEMAVLADTVVLLRAGRVIAAGPLPVLSARTDLPLAEHDDAGAVTPAVVERHDSARGLTAVRMKGGPMVLVPLLPMPTGTRIRLKVLARDIALAAAPPPEISIQNVLPARIMAMHAPAPSTVLVELDAGGPRLLARITADAASRLSLQAGVQVFALVKSSAIAVLDGRTG